MCHTNKLHLWLSIKVTVCTFSGSNIAWQLMGKLMGKYFYSQPCCAKYTKIAYETRGGAVVLTNAKLPPVETSSDLIILLLVETSDPDYFVAIIGFFAMDSL